LLENELSSRKEFIQVKIERMILVNLIGVGHREAVPFSRD
jgi:hypothetical protein